LFELCWARAKINFYLFVRGTSDFTSHEINFPLSHFYTRCKRWPFVPYFPSKGFHERRWIETLQYDSQAMLDSTEEMRGGWKSLPSNNYAPFSAVLFATVAHEYSTAESANSVSKKGGIKIPRF